jgi:hypothetical protein
MHTPINFINGERPWSLESVCSRVFNRVTSIAPKFQNLQDKKTELRVPIIKNIGIQRTNFLNYDFFQHIIEEYKSPPESKK